MGNPDPTDPEAPCGPRWQRRPDARREELIEAAVKVFGEMGFAGTRLEEVAQRAGVSKGTVYLYFDSKESLFQEMVRAKVVSNFAQGDALLRNEQLSAREMLVRFIRSTWEILRQPERARLALLVNSELRNFPELVRFYVDEVILRSRRIVRAILDLGVQRGEFRPLRHDYAVRGVTSLLVHGTIYQQFFGPYDSEALPDDEVVNGIIELVLEGVLVRDDQAGRDS
ncbi:MAG: TetR/AcrR family transcriptional regulator [Gemmatimonadota bacterium]